MQAPTVGLDQPPWLKTAQCTLRIDGHRWGWRCIGLGPADPPAAEQTTASQQQTSSLETPLEKPAAAVGLVRWPHGACLSSRRLPRLLPLPLHQAWRGQGCWAGSVACSSRRRLGHRCPVRGRRPRCRPPGPGCSGTARCSGACGRSAMEPGAIAPEPIPAGCRSVRHRGAIRHRCRAATQRAGASSGAAPHALRPTGSAQRGRDGAAAIGRRRGRHVPVIPSRWSTEGPAWCRCGAWWWPQAVDALQAGHGSGCSRRMDWRWLAALLRPRDGHLPCCR